MPTVVTTFDSILDWMNPSEAAGFSSTKSNYYLHLNPPYYCKNGPIDDISELLLKMGPDKHGGDALRVNSTEHCLTYRLPAERGNRGLGASHREPEQSHLHNGNEPDTRGWFVLVLLTGWAARSTSTPLRSKRCN